MSDTINRTLDRKDAVPAILGNHEDFLIVTGLAGTAKDIGHLTQDGDHVFALAGAMGAAVSIGLGLALAQPERRVLVITGDGELLMNASSLATVGILNPPNLSILCVDNGHYGETGWQQSHTNLGVDLETIARGSGISATRTVSTEAEIEQGSALLRQGNGTSFVLMHVNTNESPAFKRNMDPAACRVRFRSSLLGRDAK